MTEKAAVTAVMEIAMLCEQLDYLDGIVTEVLDGDYSRVWVLSTGERLYVALGACDVGLLKKMGYSFAQALGRLDDEDAKELVKRWRYEDRWAARH